MMMKSPLRETTITKMTMRMRMMIRTMRRERSPEMTTMRRKRMKSLLHLRIRAT
jgi:hypothetical protein